LRILSLLVSLLASASLFAQTPTSTPTSAPTSAPASAPARPTVGARLVTVAEGMLGKPYVFGGRDGRDGCRRHRRPIRCQPGIDCQSLIFFAYEKVCGRPWTSFSVMPARSAARGELGKPVPFLTGVLREEVDETRLQPGDVLFFLMQDYNLRVDRGFVLEGNKRYGTWHTGMLHSVEAGKARVIHAKPGERVLIEPLQRIDYDALYVLRWPEPSSCE